MYIIKKAILFTLLDTKWHNYVFSTGETLHTDWDMLFSHINPSKQFKLVLKTWQTLLFNFSTLGHFCNFQKLFL